MNEIADRKTRADAQLTCRDDNGKPLPPVTITSYEHAKKHPTMKKVLKYGVGWKFDTVEELAKHFNIPVKALKEQIDEYNGYVKSGVDEQFGKPMKKAKDKYLKAPFVTVRNWPKVHYCQGGPKSTPLRMLSTRQPGSRFRGSLLPGRSQVVCTVSVVWEAVPSLTVWSWA